MKKRVKIRVKGILGVMLLCACAAGVQSSFAQNAAGSTSSQAPDSNKPKNKQDANPFPEDINAVPVLPPANSPASAPPDAADYPAVSLPGTDRDPVKSPDDATTSADVSGSSSSSSSAGLDNLRPPPDEEQGGKHGQPSEPRPESAKDDESVGSYYLDQKNWKAALSRFESAVVLDPENPEVYWGLAEAQRHIGDYAKAKANYLKVMEYDPDSKHSKEAKRILKEPEIAGAKTVSASTSGSPQPN